MSLLEIKLIVTPLVVLVATLAARRWGDAVGGWLVGPPLTSGPVSVFLALEQGPGFAAGAADGSLAGVVAQAAFCLGYAALARGGVAAALAAGTFAYVAAATALVEAGLSRAALFLAAFAALAMVLWLVPRRFPSVSVNAVGWRETLARMVVTTALVVGLTSVATTLGPRASGVAASFPLIGASIAAFAHLRQGPAAGISVMRGMASALHAFAVFFLLAGSTLTRIPLLAAFGVAAAGALITQGVTLRFVRPAQKRRRGRWGAAASSLTRG